MSKSRRAAVLEPSQTSCPNKLPSSYNCVLIKKIKKEAEETEAGNERNDG